MHLLSAIRENSPMQHGLHMAQTVRSVAEISTALPTKASLWLRDLFLAALSADRRM